MGQVQDNWGQLADAKLFFTEVGTSETNGADPVLYTRAAYAFVCNFAIDQCTLIYNGQDRYRANLGNNNDLVYVIEDLMLPAE